MKKLLWLALVTLLVGCTPIDSPVDTETETSETQETVNEEELEDKAEIEAFKEWVLSIKDELTVTSTMLAQTELMANGRYVINDIVRLRTFDSNIQDYYANLETIMINHDSILSSDKMFKQVLSSCIGKPHTSVKIDNSVDLLNIVFLQSKLTLPRHPDEYDIESYNLYDVTVEIVEAKQPIYVPEQYIKFVRNPILLGEIGFNIVLEVK